MQNPNFSFSYECASLPQNLCYNIDRCCSKITTLGKLHKQNWQIIVPHHSPFSVYKLYICKINKCKWYQVSGRFQIYFQIIPAIRLAISYLADISKLFLKLLQIIQKNNLTFILLAWTSVLTESTHYVTSSIYQAAWLEKSLTTTIGISPCVHYLKD